jgi:hypothetical protein
MFLAMNQRASGFAGVFWVLKNSSHPLAHPRPRHVPAPAVVQEIGHCLATRFEAGPGCPLAGRTAARAGYRSLCPDED